MRLAVGALLGMVVAGVLAAQEFVPPRGPDARTGTRIGLYGFGVRAGFDFRGEGQLVVGTTLDLGDLFTRRIRLRPSAEIGVFNGPNTYVGNLEALWRFTDDDDEAAIPYLGAGIGIAGREGCGGDPDCPDLWLNIVFGVELHYGSTFNWLLEYHGMDALRRHRVYVGLTTRRSN